MKHPASIPVPGDAPELRGALMAADLPVDDLQEDGRSFFRFAGDDGGTVGFGGLETYGENALIRSVVVLPEHRGKGVGRAITEGLLSAAGEVGARHAYLLTTTATGFFERLGFARIDRKAAPADILNTRQATTICATADLLARSFGPS